MTSSTNMYQTALKNFAKLFNEAKPKEKHTYLYPIRAAGISYSHSKELGFKSTYKLWNNCLDQSKRNMGKIKRSTR